MTMLYRNSETHEKFLVEVEPADQSDYRVGIKPFRQVGEMERIDVSSVELTVSLNSNTVLVGRAGDAAIVNYAQALALRDLARKKNSARQQEGAPNGIATGRLCHSCGRPRQGRGECKHCGDDTRY